MNNVLLVNIIDNKKEVINKYEGIEMKANYPVSNWCELSNGYNDIAISMRPRRVKLWAS